MILKLSKDKKLTFYRKNPIYIGEKDFDTIEVLIPLIVDDNKTNNLNFILHLVNKNGEYLHINLDKEIKEDIVVGSTKISSTITNEAQNFFLYLELIKENNEIIGKTNCVEITIEPLPDEDTRIIPKEEYEEIIDELTEIIQENTEAMNRINEFEDGKSAYEIAVEHGFSGTEEEWLQSLIGEDGKSAYEIAVEHGYEGTEEEWLSEMKDYSKLNNKPQINSHTLSGNQSSDDLGLQKKLTAGTNILINDNGTISASGGTTDYNELENKPQIDGIPIEKNQGHEAYNLFGLSTPISWMLNFGDLVNMPSKNGILNTTIHQVESLPKFMNPKDKHFIIFDYQAVSQGIWDIAVWIDAVTNEPKMAFRAGTNNIYSVSDWVELTGGSQLVSGAVNQDGTITFIDNDGNTFTTTGKSVIGPQGPQGDKGDSVTHVEIRSDGVLYITIESADQTARTFPVGTVVGAKGADGTNGNGYDNAEINQDGDLIVREVLGTGASREVNLGHVVGAQGVPGEKGEKGDKGDKGDKGAAGEDGNAIWKTTVEPTAPNYPSQPGYGFNVTDLTGADREVQIGDIVLYSYYYYGITQIVGSVAYAETRVSIRGATGAQGDDYVLTAQDKTDIADIVLSELPTTEGVLYGNTSN